MFDNKYPYTDFHELNLDWFMGEFKKLVAEWEETKGEWNSLHDYVQNYFENLNVQTEINNKINAMILDGTFADIVSPFVTAALPALVAGQLPDIVAAQIGAVVAAQIDTVVAGQLPAVVAAVAAQEVSTWLAAHVDPDTGYVIDDTLTIPLAAADAKTVGDRIEDLNAFINGTPIEIIPNVLTIGGSYNIGDTVGTPHISQFRQCSNFALDISKLEDGLVFDSNNTLNIAFVGFDATNICNSIPTVWLSDGTYSKAVILSNARATSSTTKIGIQFKNIDGTVMNQFYLDSYCSSMYTQKLSGNAIKDESITRYKLSSDVQDAIYGNTNTVDVIMFMGQSNMAGRGTAAEAPELINGAGYEYRAISAPNQLSPMQEPFGVTENNPSGINEGSSKTGDMVISFTNAYYLHNGNVPVVGVSASKGGTSISDWQPGGSYFTDAISRLTSCVNYLTTNNYNIRHKYVLWCQGETDGDNGTSAADYKSLFNTMLTVLLANGIEKLFMVRIGNYNSGQSTRYKTIIDCQTEIAQTENDVVMASTDYAGMRDRGLMQDAFHYTQQGYNEVGDYSGINVALYEQTGKEPVMYDTEDGSLYYTHKN